MRIIFVSLALSLLIPTSVWGATQSAVTFAVKGGINPADQALHPDPETQNGKFLRFGGGVSLGFEMTPNISVDTDLLYMMKGGKYKFYGEAGYGLIQTECALDYLVVNPMLRVAPIAQGPSPYFMVGPEMGFLLRAEWTYHALGKKAVIDAKEEFKEIDVAINFGGGIDFPAPGVTSFFLEGRYSLGLTDIETEPPENRLLDPDKGTVKNRGIYLFAGLRF